MFYLNIKLVICFTGKKFPSNVYNEARFRGCPVAWCQWELYNSFRSTQQLTQSLDEGRGKDGSWVYLLCSELSHAVLLFSNIPRERCVVEGKISTAQQYAGVIRGKIFPSRTPRSCGMLLNNSPVCAVREHNHYYILHWLDGNWKVATWFALPLL